MTPALEAFLKRYPWQTGSGRRRRLLDLGCGDGALSERFWAMGYEVVGVDINGPALDAARSRFGPGTPDHPMLFARADITAALTPPLPWTDFDLVVCQLVISVVGDIHDRQRLLTNAREALRPGGHLYLSASGVSHGINPGYARLYQQDQAITGERHSYLSRDAEGNVLYQTHHFTEPELRRLLQRRGFNDITIATQEEHSSRRPDEAANFHHVTARRPGQGVAG